MALPLLGDAFRPRPTPSEDKGEARRARHKSRATRSRSCSDHGNPDLRQKTLELGRAYSQLTRKGKGVALFDEVALANDLNAAAGGSTVIASSRNANPAAATELDRLRKLDQLKQGGLLSEQEYAAKRQKIIDDL
ncbi:MAG TPA: SHOCT domain-containing protein [Thermoanaerobaculia bacterium]|nr:SHOCT domain-containing protein [Thermoanaerobaculia bacterium]